MHHEGSQRVHSTCQKCSKGPNWARLCLLSEDNSTAYYQLRSARRLKFQQNSKNSGGPLTFASLLSHPKREFLSFGELSGCIRARKYSALRLQRARVSNRLARQKHTAHKAQYPIYGLRDGLRFCGSIATSRRTDMIEVRISSLCRCSAKN
jgi:hypothetical protein